MAERYLDPEHFVVDVVDAARDLLGRSLDVYDELGAVRRAMVVETEAYGGPDDPASHAAFKPNGRAAVMFEEPGMIYVYAAYGMYPCLNIVTGPAGTPSAVLVRGVWLDGATLPTLGPGRTTRALGVSLADHGSRVGERIRISSTRRQLEISTSPRVGITRGIETPWRFIAANTAERDRRTDGYS